MDAKEKICAQNWIEQFMTEAQHTINGEWLRFAGGSGSWEIFPQGASEGMCIDCAFPWEETPQGDDCWRCRCYGLNGNANVR